MSSAIQGYNITLGSQSPLFTYLPYRDTTADRGWNSSYTDTSHAEASNGGTGIGTAYRETTLDGASIGLTFQGSAIYYCIQVSETVTYAQLTVDGSSNNYDVISGVDPSCAGYVGAKALVYVDGLEDSLHEVTMQASLAVQEYFLFFGAVITVPVASSGSITTSNVTCKSSSWTFAPDTNWHIRPDYDVMNTSSGAIGDLSGSYMAGHVYNASTTASISISNALAFYVLGPIGMMYANYTVMFNGTTSTFVPYNYFTAYQQVLFFAAGMDPSKEYDLQFQDWDPSNPAGLPGYEWIGIDTLVTMQPSPADAPTLPGTSSSSHTSSPTSACPDNVCRATSPTAIPDANTSSAASGQGTRAVPVAALVGGILGGILLIIAGVLGLLFSRRIRRWLGRTTVDLIAEEALPDEKSDPSAIELYPYTLSRVHIRPETKRRRRPLIKTSNLPNRMNSTASVISISPRRTEKAEKAALQDSPVITSTIGSNTITSPTTTSSRPDLHTVPLSELVTHLNERLQPGGEGGESAPPQYQLS